VSVVIRFARSALVTLSCFESGFPSPSSHARGLPSGAAAVRIAQRGHEDHDTARVPAPANFPNVDHCVGQEEISIQAMSLSAFRTAGAATRRPAASTAAASCAMPGRAADVNLPRTTADMSSRGASIDPDQIAPGDLIFFNTTGRPHSHVGIYVGKLRFVNAPSTGGTVRLDYLTNPYWAKRFDGIRRVARRAARRRRRCPEMHGAMRRLRAPRRSSRPRQCGGLPMLRRRPVRRRRLLCRPYRRRRPPQPLRTNRRRACRRRSPPRAATRWP
jgi:hypothetical protein